MFYSGDLICYDERSTEPKYHQTNKGKQRMKATNEKSNSPGHLLNELNRLEELLFPILKE